jgi:hypothetical protein
MRFSTFALEAKSNHQPQFGKADIAAFAIARIGGGGWSKIASRIAGICETKRNWFDLV